MSAKTGIDGDYLDLKKTHVQACIEIFSRDMESLRVAEDEVNQLPIDEIASDSGATLNATASDGTVNDLVPSYRSSVDYVSEGFPTKWLGMPTALFRSFHQQRQKADMTHGRFHGSPRSEATI